MSSSTFDMLHSAGSITTWPIDWLVIGIFIALVALDTFRSGTSRAMSFMFAFPIAAMLSSLLPSSALISSVISSFSSVLPQAIIFGVLFVVIFTLVYRAIGPYGFSSATLPHALLMGFAAAIIAIALWMEIPALSSLWHFNALIATLFAEGYRLFWIIAAYVILAFVRI